ncbi:hypothetical protein [Granulicella arctica]|uniref:Outer membrane lipoprotein-sorting protein n=1 Tax=Granulicella arctica TaxID=940613 RepID=A0A7Y9PK06_9BACT|nr:hypothetical protein [Granulicella arctica]NYF81319.1 hypothetical protein [Granulicella arctica]
MRTLVLSGFLFGAALLCPDRASAQAPTASEIVTRMMERNAQRQAMLQHYASDRTYRLEYNGTAGEHHAEMVVHAEYSAPGRKHFTVISESGSKVLCAEVLRKLVEGEEETAAKQDWQRAMFSPETYNLQLLGNEQLDGIHTWVLQVEPKVASKVAYRGKVWVSMEDFATVRVLGEPAKSPSWFLSRASFDSWYMRRGEVWVPSKNVSTTHVRIGGEAKVTIDYGQYPVLDTTPVSASVNPRTEGDLLQQPLPPTGVVMTKGLSNSFR